MQWNIVKNWKNINKFHGYKVEKETKQNKNQNPFITGSDIGNTKKNGVKD